MSSSSRWWAHFIDGRREREKTCLVPFEGFIFDVVLWSLCLLLAYRMFRIDRRVLEVLRLRRTSSQSEQTSSTVTVTVFDRIMDTAFLSVHLSFCILFVYICVVQRSLVDLLEPTSMIVALQTVTLLSKGEEKAPFSGLLLPMSIFPVCQVLVSCFGGSGSDNNNSKPLLIPLSSPFPALDAFWITKVLLLLTVATPIHLLARNNFAAYKATSLNIVLIGVWFSTLYFIWLLAPTALLLDINLSGVLCAPTVQQSILQVYPAKLLAIASHRSLSLPLIVTVSVALSFVYISIVGVLFFACSFLAIRKSIDEVDRGIGVQSPLDGMEEENKKLR